MSNTDVCFADGLRHLYIPNLNSVSATSNGLRHWLGCSNDYIFDSQIDEDVFSIRYYNPENILSALASDINRLSCASLETINNIFTSIVNRKFLAWNLISYYYSAFYSANCILKTLGFGLIQIDDRISTFINSRATAYGISLQKINNGIYCMEFQQSKGSIVFYKVRKYSDSHRGLWFRFAEMLKVLSGISIINNSFDANCITAIERHQTSLSSVYYHLSFDDASIISNRIDGLIENLNRNGDYNWLSYIRNRLNYSHEYGVWYPYQNFSKHYEKVNGMKDMCCKSPLDNAFDTCNEEDLVEFVKTCQLINSICFNVLSDLITRHPLNKSFIKSGLVHYGQQYGIDVCKK